jgi:hypothetical protein
VDIVELLSEVDPEKLYDHVLKLEGPKHPIDNPDKLNHAADYIHSRFEEYGLEAYDQEFQVQGFNGKFRNIEGALKNADAPELLIVSHYDTVSECPGADDNASAIAIMLEAARILAREENVRNVRFVSFSLEELNPARELTLRRTAQDIGLRDEHHRYTSARTHNVMKQLEEIYVRNRAAGKNPSEAWLEARMQLQDQMSESEIRYAKKIEEIEKGSMRPRFCVGSDFWVKEALQAKKAILGVLCYDTAGYTSNKEHSQTYPQGLDPKMFQTYCVKDTSVGNFLAVIGDVNSSKLVQSFCTQSQIESVGLPYACLQVPLGYQAMAQGMPDLLRSDHACFWQESIPGLFLTDSAEFRNPYYHTQADTIDKLNFDFMTKICKATIATAVDMMTRH